MFQQEAVSHDRVGVDTGGTFTDFVFLSQKGNLHITKRLSTPSDPSLSVLAGLQEALAEGLLSRGFLPVHGTTVATNALLERRGAPTALLTTEGLRDVLAIGRQTRQHLYALHPSRSEPLLPRELCFDIPERLDWCGKVLNSLDEESVIEILDSLRQQGITSLAVCLLFSYLNPVHEQRIGELAHERGFAVSLSSEIAPEPREFERASTTVANAFVSPVMNQYLTRLEASLAGIETRRLRIMQSNGGSLSAGEAGRLAVKTVLSGPAGGVAAAITVGQMAGFHDLLTFDMGGTSTDVALIEGGFCPVITTGTLAGMPVRTPMLDIHTVGAGGGSLARLDAAGGLRVGPQSAGADPGPVAYGRGENLTVTDANILLGRLPAETRLAGTLPLDANRVRTCLDAFTAQMGGTAEEAAEGILTVANAVMARALRHVSVERGYDPARFTLFSFGGAGGLHACELAEALAMRSVLVPRYPGAFSALGLALSPVSREFVRAFPPTPFPPQGEKRERERTGFTDILHTLETAAHSALQEEGIPEAERRVVSSLDMRYVGQSFDLRIPFDPRNSVEEVLADFHARHRARYGHADPSEPVETVAVRISASGGGYAGQIVPELPATQGEPAGDASVYIAGGWQKVPLWQRETLAHEQKIAGPGIVLQSDATTWLPPGWSGSVDATGNLILTR